MNERQQSNRLPNKQMTMNAPETTAGEKFWDYFAFLKRSPKHWFVKGESDLIFFIAVFFLLCFGLVMVFSSSYIIALNDSVDAKNNPYHYFVRQLAFSAFGLFVLYMFSKLRPEFIREFSVLILIVSVVLLIVVLFHHTTLPGREGIKRFIPVPVIRQIQPSEIAKLGLVMFMAWSMERNFKLLARKSVYLFPYIALIILFIGLVYLEHHLSGTILMLCLGIAMLFLSGAKMRWFLLFGTVAVVGMAVGIYCFWLIANKPEEAARFLPERFVNWGRHPDDAPYTIVRVIAWLNKDFQPLGARWQTNNSLYAIASGGLFGKGIGNSLQKHLYLSEAQNDFIFSIICEELGFIGALFVIALFGVLIWRGFIIAKKAKDRFSSLLVMGIVFQVGLQAAIHIAVVTDTIPNTGIGLPFISYGGTSLIILLAEMGMVLSVSRTAKMKKM